MNRKVIHKYSEEINIDQLWRSSLAAIFLSITTILFIYKDTVVNMVSLWSASDTYAHGFIVPFITLWLIWRIKEKWIILIPRNSWTALILMLGFAAIWLMGNLVAVNALTQLALVSLIILCVPALFGWSVTSKLAFPLLFLYFSVPIGDFLLPIMMNWTADFTVLALRFTGIPVYREGLQFVIPSGNWSVVEACSGIRYLIASVTVGCLFSYLNYQSYKKRIAFVVISIIVPLIANWVRAYLIVLIGHYSGNELATGVDHLIYGWLFFGLVIVTMLYIGAIWTDKTEIKNVDDFTDEGNLTTNNKNWKFFSIILLITLIPHVLENWSASNINNLPVKLGKVSVMNPWKGTESTIADWEPGFLHSAAQFHSGFINEDKSCVGIHISYYRQQDYKSKLVTSTNNLVNNFDKKWIEISSNKSIIETKGNDLKFNDAVLRKKEIIETGDKQFLRVWYFYWVNNEITSNDFYAKLQGALGRMLGNGDDAAMIAVYTPYKSTENLFEEQQSTNKILQNFMSTNITSIVSALQETKNNK